jgi:hypothetical protein
MWSALQSSIVAFQHIHLHQVIHRSRRPRRLCLFESKIVVAILEGTQQLSTSSTIQRRRRWYSRKDRVRMFAERRYLGRTRRAHTRAEATGVCLWDGNRNRACASRSDGRRRLDLAVAECASDAPFGSDSEFDETLRWRPKKL